MSATAPAGKLRDHPAAALYPRLGRDDLDALTEDIRRRGLMVPILLHEGRVLDGRHRLAACRAAGVEPRFEEYMGDDPIGAVVSLNGPRRHLTPSQRACVAVELEALYAADAAKRMRAGRRLEPSDEIAGGSTAAGRETRALAATAAGGVSSGYVSAAKRLKRDAPEVFARVFEGDMTLQEARRDLRDARRAATLGEAAARVAASPKPETLEGVYATVLIDPPWRYADEGDKDPYGRALPTYPVMSEEELEALPVAQLAAPDAYILLWATNRGIVHGKHCRLLAAWGLEPITLLTWTKPTIGLGRHLRNSTEHIVIARKGSPEMLRHDVGTWLATSETRRRHSEKPAEAYELIESAFPGPRLELFARQRRDGWVSWGGELPAE